MRLQEISNKKIIIERYHNQQQQLLESVCRGMTSEQKFVVENIVKHFQPLVEYALTQDQINSVFGSVEKNVTATGSNRTALGKSKDVVAAANRMIDDAGRWLQNTTPVQGFDQRFEKIKRDLRDKLGTSTAGRKVLTLVDNLGDYAKENPGKTAFAIGVLTAVAAIATGPVGGAIAGQVLRGSMELAKGEKLSTAVGKGLKTAAIGALAGLSVEAIGDALGDAATSIAGDIWPNGEKFIGTFKASGTNVPSTWQNIEIYGTPEQIEQIKDSWNSAIEAWRSRNYGSALDQFEQAKQLADQALDSVDTLADDLARADVKQSIQDAMKVFDGLAAAAQGAATGATAFDDNGKPVQESININQLFTHIAYLSEKQQLDEISLASIKQQAAKIAQRGIQKAQDVGKNMTTRVTVSKLQKAWEKAGSPTDSEAIAQLLAQQGIKSEIINKSFKDHNLEAPNAQTQEPADDQQPTDDEQQPMANEPVDTPNNKFDGAIQKYLADKKLARGGLTYKLLPDILKTNNYAKPEQWLKNAGIQAKNPGQVVSNKDLQKLADYLADHSGRMGKGATTKPKSPNQMDMNKLAADIKKSPQLAQQIIQYLQQNSQSAG